MTKLFTQMRNEWRSNLWLTIELLLVSIVLWFCLSRIIDYITVLNEPRGHDISHVYKITPGRIPGMDSERPDYENVLELAERIRRRPEVEAVALSRNATPYCGSTSNINIFQDDSIAPIFSIGYAIRRWIQSDFFKVYRIGGARGESPEQLAELLRPGINVFGATPRMFRQPAKELEQLNSVDLIGQSFYFNGYPDHTLAAVTNPMKRFDYDRLEWAEPSAWDMMVPFGAHLANEMSVRVKAEMDSPDWIDNLMDDSESQLRVGTWFVMDAVRMADLRQSTQKSWTIYNRNYIVGLIFLLLNIVLGLLGSFWYRTQMRVSDIAILKVFGATEGNIFRRLMAEGLILLCLATPLALLGDWLLIKYGLLSMPAAFGAGYSYQLVQQLVVIPLLSFALLAVMVIAGIYIPARRAMKIAPALALRSE